MSGASDIYRNRDGAGAISLIGPQRPTRYPTLASDANLVAYFEMQGNSRGANMATTATDITYSAANGRFGVGAGFDGDSSKIVTAANIGIAGNAVFSYLAWIKNANTAGAYVLLDSGLNDVLKACSIWVNNAGAGDFGLAFAGGNNANSNAGLLGVGDWHHIAITKAAGAINTTTSLYLDGVAIALAAGASTGTPNITNSPLTIGYSTVFGGYYYPGAIGELMLFNDVVTAAEIAEYYNWCLGLA
jgi:hypothetical protein